MKKFKKLLAGLLTGAMLLGSMSVSAFAADKTPVFDTTKTTGSITIHKYTDEAGKGDPATGKEDASQVPTGAVAIKDVGFTIYQVADATKLADYYSSTPESLPAVSQYCTGSGKNVQLKPDVANEKYGDEVKTDASGVAKFENLPLGLYLVVETTSPAIVTGPCDPFLISVPMTTDGDDWLYDVHVYPKNKTTYGGVTLEKKGNNTTALSGVTFVLQKQNGTEWTNVTKNEKNNSDLSLVTNPEGKINVDGLSQGTYRFIETDRGGNDGYIMDGAKTYEFVVGSDGKITYDGKTENNITITVTNEKPDMTKQVKDRKSGAWKQETDYNVGDMVPYQITVDVPSNITKLKEFTLTDTPTNLDDKVENVKVTCENADVAANAYSVAKEGDHGFKITFTPANMNAYAGKQLVITYNAELLSTAVTTTVGNTNSAKLEYSNKILPGQDGDPYNPNKPENPDTKPGKDYIENTTTVYTFGLQVVKKAEKADGTPLGGVKFDLYKYAGTESNPNPTEAELKANGTLIAKNLTTDTDGTITKSGLANGTYYLVETKTHDGYNLLKAPVKVELSIVYTTSTKDEYYKDENGVKTLVKHEVETTTFTEKSETSTGTHTETIINKKGFTLPITGGMGTIAITALGVALAFAGVLIIGASRKKTVK